MLPFFPRTIKLQQSKGEKTSPPLLLLFVFVVFLLPRSPWRSPRKLPRLRLRLFSGPSSDPPGGGVLRPQRPAPRGAAQDLGAEDPRGDLRGALPVGNVEDNGVGRLKKV